MPYKGDQLGRRLTAAVSDKRKAQEQIQLGSAECSGHQASLQVEDRSKNQVCGSRTVRYISTQCTYNIVQVRTDNKGWN